MKNLLAAALLTCALNVSAQDSLLTQYQKARDGVRTGNLALSYSLSKDLHTKLKTEDTLYNYNLWSYINVVLELEKNARMKEDFNQSLSYAQEAMELIQEGKKVFNADFAKKEPWTIKNLLVSSFASGKMTEAKRYKQMLYQRHKDNSLPEGIDQYFNFDYFILDDKNVWGYEWFAELPEDRFSTSFTKIVYYVYSRKTDGSDEDQLYRFHVLMFHQDSKDAKFDYVLERQTEENGQEISGTYYSYLYNKDIDYEKLKKDIKEIITNKIEPDTRRSITRQ